MLTVRFRDTPGLSDDARKRTIVLVPKAHGGVIAWDCTGGDMPAGYRSTECRR